jgi:putative NADH-flavin reductase
MKELTAKVGDVYDTASLAAVIRGNDAVISAFNPGWKDPNLYDDQVRGTTSIIAAIKDAGIKRVLWVGGAGGLEVKPGVRHARTASAASIYQNRAMHLSTWGGRLRFVLTNTLLHP